MGERMVSINIFLPRLLPSVLGCSEPLALQALLDAAIEFCVETHIVRMTPDPRPIIPGVSAYEVDVPMQQRVALVQRAWYGKTALQPALSSMISNVDAYAPVAPPDDQVPNSFFESAPGEVSVFPTPGSKADGQLVFRVATQPTRSATQVEDILFDDWVEAIVHGALKRLHMVPDTPFFSDVHASRRASMFQLEISRARAEAQRGRIRGSLTTVAPRSFA
jgi:hypothetical protein